MKTTVPTIPGPSDVNGDGAPDVRHLQVHGLAAAERPFVSSVSECLPMGLGRLIVCQRGSIHKSILLPGRVHTRSNGSAGPGFHCKDVTRDTSGVRYTMQKRVLNSRSRIPFTIYEIVKGRAVPAAWTVVPSEPGLANLQRSRPLVQCTLRSTTSQLPMVAKCNQNWFAIAEPNQQPHCSCPMNTAPSPLNTS